MAYDGLSSLFKQHGSSTIQRRRNLKRLDKATINELPLIRFQGSVKVAEDTKTFHRLASKLRKQRVLGFDIECKPNFKRGPNNPPALIQLATADQAFLFAFIQFINSDLGRDSRRS